MSTRPIDIDGARMSADVTIDPVRCTGHGLCALLLAERITLDNWGFPVVDRTPVDTRGLLRKARRASRACPRKALLVTLAEHPATGPTVVS